MVAGFIITCSGAALNRVPSLPRSLPQVSLPFPARLSHPSGGSCDVVCVGGAGVERGSNDPCPANFFPESCDGVVQGKLQTP